jgi:hypothetical protein
MSLPPPSDNYIGEPQYPAPWTTKKPREGLRDTDAALIVSLAPDVCKSPSVPIPYPIVDFCGHDENYTKSVRFTAQNAMVLRSNTTHVHGDEPGVGKGVKSGTVGARCHPIEHADQVFAEGSPVIRHLDRCHMNDRNTVGEAIFVRDTKTYEPPKDDDPVPGSLVMSDAMPEPLILGAQYAQALPQPSPRSPAPRPPGQVIRPNVPQWNRPPPGKSLPVGKTLGRLGRLGRLGTGIGVFIEGMWPTSTAMPWYDEVPQDAFERDLFAKARELEKEGIDPDEINDWFRGERAENARRKAKEKADADAMPKPVPVPDTVRVDKNKRPWKCLVGEYQKILKACTAMGGNTHHIVPDMAYRLGSRPSGAGAGSALDRVPNAPTLNQGMSICLTPAQHGSGPTGIHGRLRGSLNALGTKSQVPGTAPMGQILAASNAALLSTPNLDAKCKALGAASATAQVRGKTGFSAPGRTLEAPLPTGRAYQVLHQGHY